MKKKFALPFKKKNQDPNERIGSEDRKHGDFSELESIRLGNWLHGEKENEDKDPKTSPWFGGVKDNCQFQNGASCIGISKSGEHPGLGGVMLVSGRGVWQPTCICTLCPIVKATDIII